MDTKTSSAKIINAIKYLDFLNRMILEHNDLATPKLPKINSSLQIEAKHTRIAAHTQGKLLEHLYPTFENLTKTFSNVGIKIVENLLAAMLNSKQPGRKVSPASF